MLKKIFFSSFLLVIALALAACQSPGQKVSEKMAEKAIEKASGGKANVDISKDQVNINTGEGSMKLGEDIKLPSDFPKDVYVYEGTIKAAIKSNDKNGYTISIETDKAVSDIKAAYEEKLPVDGWKITGTMDFGTSASLAAEKDNRTVSVIIGLSDEKASIVLTVAEK